MTGQIRNMKGLTKLIFDGNNKLRKLSDGKRKFGDTVNANPIGPPRTVNTYTSQLDNNVLIEIPKRANAYVLGDLIDGPKRNGDYMHSTSIQFYRLEKR